MVGTLPRTKILVTKDEVVMGHFNNYTEVVHAFGISVSDEGVVTFYGQEQTPHYVMRGDGPLSSNHWDSKSDVISDWARYHLKMPRGCQLYRYLV